jgi:hypothetical protein
MDLQSVEYMKKHDMFYDLILRLKSSELSEEIELREKILNDFGFWAPREDVKSEFVTDFERDRRSFVLKAPDGWSLGDMPVEGHYVLVKVWKSKGDGDKKWSANVSNFELKLGVPTSTRGRDIYLFCFLNGDEYLRYMIHDFCTSKYKDEMPEIGSKDYEGRLDWDKKVEEMRLECLKMAPDLAHYTWPQVIVFSGKWAEKKIEERGFFEKTFSLLMGEFDVGIKRHLDFEPLEWKDGASNLTRIVKYYDRDEYKLREYGVNEKVEMEREIGMWLKKVGDAVTFECVRYWGGNWFVEFSGELSEGCIRLELETPVSKVGKDVMVDYFDGFGLEPGNLPESVVW